MKRLFALGAAMGAALEYFFDPDAGKRRRSMTRDRVLGFFRRAGRKAERAGQGAKSQAYGLSQKVAHLKERPKEQPDDATLARKVETELFRGADVSDLKVAAGTVIMMFALLLLARERGASFPRKSDANTDRPSVAMALCAGALSGIMGAALAMPGPVAMLYLSAARLSKDQSRALALAFFTFVYGAVCLLHAWDGGLSAARMALAAKLLLAVFAGAVAGHWLARHVSEARYRQLVLVILFVAGLYAVLSA